MSVYQYDILKDTWIYAEIKQQVQEEEHSEQVQEYRQMLQAIVQARFPRLESLTKDVGGTLTSPAALRDLIVKVSTAKIEKVVRQYLIEEKKNTSEEIA
jgi:predicted transcriptional regulator